MSDNFPYSTKDACFIKAPPFLEKMPLIAKRATPPLYAQTQEDQRNPLLNKLTQQELGSFFWRADAPFKVDVVLFISQASLEEAERFYRQTLSKRYAQDKILILVPQGSDLQNFAHFPPSPIATEDYYNPYSYVKTLQEVHAFTRPSRLPDISLLGVLGSVPTFIYADRNNAPTQLREKEVSEIIFDKTSYFSPFTGQAIGFSQILPILGLWKEIITKNRSIEACFGISPWKKKTIEYFLQKVPGEPLFPWSPRSILRRPETSPPRCVTLWASHIPRKKYRALLDDKKIKTLFMEDGFIRSRGLGCAFTPPNSITIDSRGLYHDPTHESDLEYLLQHHDFSPSLLKRASKLIRRLRDENISKYGASTGDASPDTRAISHIPKDKWIIAVPGQVYDDLSVKRGSPYVKDNLTLLKKVRQDNPKAWIIYRPHPDVEAGFRQGGVEEQDALRYADEINRKAPLTALFSYIDEIHTMTSLSGFEAIIRDIPVTTWGIPFYAGWGLTRDKAPIPSRRTRNLSPEALVAAALILYPRYLDPLTNLPCPVEIVLDRMADPQPPRRTFWMYLRLLQKKLHI